MTELRGKKYHIITFGCQMNEHDSEIIAGLLQEEGCSEVQERKDADIVVASPSPTSGTAALVGAMKAYARMSGQVIEPQVLKTATAELLESGEPIHWPSLPR